MALPRLPSRWCGAKSFTTSGTTSARETLRGRWNVRTRVRDLRLLAFAFLGFALSGPVPVAAQNGSAARPLVVIDAGHGGVDPGARGPNGTREKDVTLAIARNLAELLRKDGAY